MNEDIQHADPAEVVANIREWMRGLGVLSERRDPSLGTIYFIKCGDMPIVKIGFTNGQCTKARFHTLQTSSPFDLSIVLQMDGTEAQEKELHAKFSRARIRGEWFWMMEDVLAFIESKTPMGKRP